jgi:tetratricopeptide (TPR) repeat protein
LGAALRRLERYEAALEPLDRVIRLDPSGAWGPKARLQKADCLFLSGRVDEAIRDYRRTLSVAVDSSTAWEIRYRLGMAELERGDEAAAFAWFHRCVASAEGGRLWPRAVEKAWELARRQGKVEEEGWILQRAARRLGAKGAGWTWTARYLRWVLRRGDPADALETSQALLREAPKDSLAIAQVLRARLLYRTGRTGEARGLLQQAERALGADHPEVFQARLAAAVALLEAGRASEAARELERLEKDCPDPAGCERAAYYRALALLQSRRGEEGIREASAFLRSYPLSPFAGYLRLRLGSALYDRGLLAEAAQRWQEAVEAPDSAVVVEALRNLAIVQEKLERWREAERTWRTLVDRFPGSGHTDEASLRVARCQLESGRPREAARTYEAIAPILEGEYKARAYFGAGECYERMQRWKSALLAYLKVPYLVPEEAIWSITARLKAAHCYRELGKVDQAARIYHDVIRRYGRSSQWGRFAEQELRALEAAGKGSDGER